ncbi:MAG TPA: DnaJ domain-containing protein [Chthoniobacteraceae bacterium]|jgi:curved DNA-binding protein
MEPEEADHYAILGLDRRCTVAQIRTAYRLLAKRFHPDKNPNSADAVEQAQRLNAAHEILSDPARRRAYDRELDQTEVPASSPRVKLERNIVQDARLRIEDFIRGATLNIEVNDPAHPDGPEHYELVVPEETAPGTRFRLPRTAPFENGFVIVRVRPLPGFRFKVRGADLRCDLRINARRAAQGGSEMISGPTGAPLRLSIPPGVGRGEIVRVAQQGMPKPRGGRGDLLVRITYRPEVRISRA